MKTLSEITTYLKSKGLHQWNETFNGFERTTDEGFGIKVVFFEENGFLKAKFTYKHPSGNYVISLVYKGVAFKPICFEVAVDRFTDTWLQKVGTNLMQLYRQAVQAPQDEKKRIAEQERKWLQEQADSANILTFVNTKFEGFVPDTRYVSFDYDSEEGWFTNLDKTVWIKPLVKDNQVVLDEVILNGSAARNFKL